MATARRGRVQHVPFDDPQPVAGGTNSRNPVEKLSNTVTRRLLGEQAVDHMAADEAGAAGDQDALAGPIDHRPRILSLLQAAIVNSGQTLP